MAYPILQDTIDGLSFNLDQAIAAFQIAWTAHAYTVGLPSPCSDPLVEIIVKEYGGKYLVVEPETKAPLSNPDSLTAKIAQLTTQLSALADRVAALEALPNNKRS